MVLDNNDGLTFLLEGKSEQSRDETFESSVARSFVKKLGMTAKQLARIEKASGKPYTFSDFFHTYANFPFDFHTCRLSESFNLHDLFMRPTKTEAYKEYMSLKKQMDVPDKYFVLFFRVKGFTTLAMTDCPHVYSASDTSIQFKCYNAHSFIVTLEDLASTCKHVYNMEGFFDE